MPRGDKSRYSESQKRKAARIEESYEARGVDSKEAEARAWATVNKQTGGGRKVSARRKSAARRNSAKRAVATRRGHSPNRGRASARKSRRSGTRTAARRGR